MQRAIKLYADKRGSHVKTTVFMGEDMEHLANCGAITTNLEEHSRLSKILAKGCDHYEYDYTVTRNWED